jgi:hypothetical protein
MSSTATTFESLGAADFESFCYDLLVDLGFQDVDWRKGTDLNASPSDRGRDIVCHLDVPEVRGARVRQKWFVECKHWVKGVPPEKLQSALSWARLEKPQKLLFMVSGFLSNPAKDYLERIINEEKPPFRIEWWERPKLLELALGSAKLLRKYALAGDHPFVDLLHPAHLEYIRQSPINSLDYLFALLDPLDHDKRREAMGGTFFLFVNPSAKQPTSRHQTLRDLVTQPFGYAEFREKSYALRSVLPDLLIVRSIIAITLNEVFQMGDLTRTQQVIENHKGAISFFNEKVKEFPAEANDLRACIKMSEKMIEELPQRIKSAYELYSWFCDEVVAKLFRERLSIELPPLPST